MTEHDIPVPVLLVDDNPAKLLALGAALDGMAVDIVTATSGMEALHQLLVQEFAVVLLDVNMPVMNGFETATLIRSRPRSEHLPILFITSEALTDDSRLQGYALGAVDYVLSPVLPLILRAKVATFADLYRLREQSVRQNLELTETQAQLSRINESLEANVQERTEQARSLFEHNADGIMVIGHDERICAANPAAAKLFGRPVEALLGVDFGSPVVAEESAEIVIPSNNGKAKTVEMRSAEILWESQEATLATLRDITERKRMEVELRIAAVTFETQEGILITDKDARILHVNKAFTKLTGYSAEEAVGKKPSILQSGRHDAAFYRAMWKTLLREGYWQGEIWDRGKDGTIYPTWLTINAVADKDGQVTHYVGAFSDIAPHQQAEEMRQLALYDPLTQLPNRRLLNDRLGQALAASKRSGRYGTVIFLDLDNFKPLNDTHGHLTGDLLLIEVARRLKNCMREVDTVARFGGDEFALLANDLHEDKAEAILRAGIVAEKIRVALAEPYLLTVSIDGKPDVTVEHHCTASIGVALFVHHQVSAVDILKRADSAMYQAKEAGRNLIRFYLGDGSGSDVPENVAPMPGL